MERRVLIALVLSFLVLYVYQTYVVKPVPKPAQTAAQQTQAPAAGQPAGSPVSEVPAADKPAEAPAAPAAQALVGGASERDVRIETQDIVATFTNRGARLKSWRLKKYLDP